MIDFQSVFSDFINISGLSETEAKKQNKLINLAIDYLHTNLKPGIDIDANKNLLSMLAAAIAYHKYMLIKESSMLESSIKLGDVSVSTNSSSSIKSANNLKNDLLSLASHLLLTPNFIFRQV